MTNHLLSDELMLPDVPIQSRHPMDSSGVLLGLMALARKAQAGDDDAPHDGLLDGVISRGVLWSLLSALHYRDVTSVRHSRRVAFLAVGMGRYLAWEGRQLKVLEVAGLLHDIGKIGVPDNILFKPGALNPDEIEVMALHRNIGVDVLQACRVAPEVLEIVSQANGDFNGATDGYKRVGSDLNMGARILAVADAYESLSSDQVYRTAKPHDEVMKILMESAGTQFDGNIVCALSRWVESEGIPFAAFAADQKAADRYRGPEHVEEALEASSLCHIFSYLYLLESLYDGFHLVDADLRFVVWNNGSERLLGLPAHDLLGQVWTSRLLSYSDQQGRLLADDERPLHKAIESGKASTSQLKMQHADGRWIPVELQTVPLFDARGRLQGVTEIFRDLSRTNRRPQEYRELKLAASRDALTSVANRGELETQLTMMVSEFSQEINAEPFSIIFLDVDHFKSFNDTYGHTVGDEVLVEVARLLQHETYSGELVGRYGGEEFVILCPDTHIDQAVKRAERLRLAICHTRVDGAKDRQITASFGVAEIESGDSVESILRRADKALYSAKGNGRNRTCSLTTAQLLRGENEANDADTTASAHLRFTGSFAACVASDMIVYKLGGFVDENRATLVEVTATRVVIRVGKRRLLPFWGKNDDRRPVELEIEFGDQKGTSHDRRGSNSRIMVSVRIRPLGWVRSNDLFQARAKRVMRSLKSYFVVNASEG